MVRPPHKQAALTLVECLMASVVLVIAVGALTQAVVAGQMQTADALHRARALGLAEALMDEVLRLPYTDPDGTDGEAVRANFDDLDDFDAFSEAVGALNDAGGTAYDAVLQTFTRAVIVAPAGGGGGISVTGFADPVPGLIVTVTVQDAAGETWALTRFREEPPP